MGTTNRGTNRKKIPQKSDPAVSYDEFKEFEGQRYTGAKVGRTHKWYYDKGEWKETKITPDVWQISYAVNKRRAGRAPEGSGVPVGTEYHWYVLAHQNVQKLNANDYTTTMAGVKFKIAHRRADSEKWSATPKTQRRRMIGFLRDVIADLEQQIEEEEAAKERERAERTAAKERERAEKAAARERARAEKAAAKKEAAAKKAAAKKAAPKKAAKKPARKAAARKAAEKPARKAAARKAAEEPARKPAAKKATERPTGKAAARKAAKPARRRPKRVAARTARRRAGRRS